MWEKGEKKSIILYKSLILEEITNKCGGRCLEEASYTLNDVTFCESEIPRRGSIFTKFPRVKNAVKIWHLRGFGENSRSSTNFQDSEDVSEDVISSLG